MTAIDIEELQRWKGRTQSCTDVIAAVPVTALSATLDYECSRALPGEALPSCWHWLYFQDAIAASGLAEDGHPLRGEFLPPVPLPRRMWAGSRLRFVSPLRVGDEARKVSKVASIERKQGRNGELVFVTVEHRIYSAGTLAIEEEQDLVYRGHSTGTVPSAPSPGLAQAQWSREVRPDSVLLFRYSALTFNSHRIHYDRDYANDEEGYSSLVVQGPLMATLLLDLLYREVPGAEIVSFEFRAMRPVLEGKLLCLQGCRNGSEVSLWALDDTGELAVKAQVRLITS